MYEFIRGNIIERNPASIVIEASGVGYFINISLNTYSKIGTKKEGILFLHQVVREDAHVLYGFAEKEERTLFRNLISVNGVGSSTAIMMLSSLNPDEIIERNYYRKCGHFKGVKGHWSKNCTTNYNRFKR